MASYAAVAMALQPKLSISLLSILPPGLPMSADSIFQARVPSNVNKSSLASSSLLFLRFPTPHSLL
jgi:hypothetical protein